MSPSAITDATKAQETTSRRRRGFVAVVVLCAVVIALAIAGLVTTGDPGLPLSIVLTLAFLFSVAEHRGRVYSDETGMSGSIAVGVCAATYVGSQGWVVGAFFICSAGALYLPHLRARSWTKVIVNMGCFGVSGLVAGLVVHAIESTAVLPSEALVGLAAIPAVAAYWACNSLLIGAATAALGGRNVVAAVWELIRSETVMLVFAVGGAMCGLVMVEVSRWTGIAALVALLVALDVFVISVPAGPTTLRAAWKMMVSRAAAAAVGCAVGAAIPRAIGSAVVGALLGGIFGLAAGLATVTLVALVRLRLARARVDGALLLGFVVAEVALPAIGTASGIVGAFAGLGPAIATAAGLVIAASIAALWRRRADEPEVIDEDFLLATVAEAMFDGLPHPSHRA